MVVGYLLSVTVDRNNRTQALCYMYTLTSHTCLMLAAKDFAVMIAQSVSLGVLSLPSSMATLGLVPYV